MIEFKNSAENDIYKSIYLNNKFEFFWTEPRIGVWSWVPDNIIYSEEDGGKKNLNKLIDNFRQETIFNLENREPKERLKFLVRLRSRLEKAWKNESVIREWYEIAKKEYDNYLPYYRVEHQKAKIELAEWLNNFEAFKADGHEKIALGWIDDRKEKIRNFEKNYNEFKKNKGVFAMILNVINASKTLIEELYTIEIDLEKEINFSGPTEKKINPRTVEKNRKYLEITSYYIQQRETKDLKNSRQATLRNFREKKNAISQKTFMRAMTANREILKKANYESDFKWT